MNKFCATIYGRPRPLQRGRHTSRATKPYNKANLKNKKVVQEAVLRELVSTDILTPLKGPLYIRIAFVFARPKSDKKREKIFYEGVPDIDNLAKLVLDALNGVLWNDDAQIGKLDCVKLYGDEDRTILVVSPLKIGILTRFMRMLGFVFQGVFR